MQPRRKQSPSGIGWVLSLPRPKGWVVAALQLLPCPSAGDAVAADAPLVFLATAAWIYPPSADRDTGPRIRPPPLRPKRRQRCGGRGKGKGASLFGVDEVNTGQAVDFRGRNACGMVLR